MERVGCHLKYGNKLLVMKIIREVLLFEKFHDDTLL